MTILGNQKTGDEIAGLGLMAAVESTANAGPTLEQVRPGWVDFRLGVRGTQRAGLDPGACDGASG